MPRPAAAKQVARGASRLLPPPVRGLAFRRLAPLLRLGGARDGLASLVVLTEGVDLPRLTETLESIRYDAHAYREVLVAPVGPDVAAAAREVLRGGADPRVRILGPQPTWQDAANAGAAAAHGAFLQFQRACDPHLPDALADLVGSLVGSGSDLAVGAIAQRGRGAAWLERTTALVHDREATGLTPADHPVLGGDLGLGNKLFRTAGWRAVGRRLTPQDGWLLAPTLASYLSSVRRFDVLARTVQEHVAGHGIRPYGAMPTPLRDLAAWVARAEQVETALAGSPLLDGWRRHVRDIAVPGYLLDAERATDDQWALLRSLADRHPSADDDRAEARTLLWLTRQDRRADLVDLAIAVAECDGDVPTTLAGPDVLAAWPGLPADVPDHVRRLSAAETPLRGTVRRRTGGDVELFVRVDHVDLGAHDVAVTADVDVTATEDPAATRWAASRFARALRVRGTVPPGVGSIHLTVTVGAVTRSGEVDLAPPWQRATGADRATTVTAVALDGDRLRVDHTGPLRLVDDADRVVAELDGPHVDLRDVHYGRERWLPTGWYRLVTPTGIPTVSDGFLASLPLEHLGDHHRVTVTLGPAGGLLVHLGPPLADDELGPWAQERLIASYAADTSTPDPGTLYFESYAGRSATDSPRAIHEALRARRPDLTTYWGVLDHAQEVPDGATPVLLRSREWYAVLARAGGLVVNTDMEAWFRRREGQVLLQTFHGYPSKGMGLGQWRAAHLPESQVAVLRARGVDTWSVILTPTPEMTRHYREQYGYEGPALEHGYPRDDALVAPDAAEVRRRTRDLLGIRDDQTAVLYAPTWREHQAWRPRKADMVDFLDVDEAAAALGPSHVLLLRGHRFHAPRGQGRGHGSRVVDVGDHPEINDLVLAADVAVLDYSSLRFDVALTGTPMVFLVPDLADYTGGTRAFLFPFEDSAPGPFVADTASVVEQVRDAARLRAAWADRIAAFNAAYQPHQDGHAADRVADALLSMLDGGG